MPHRSITIQSEELIKTVSSIKTGMRGTYRPAVGIFCGQECLKIRSGPLTSIIPGTGGFAGMAILPLTILIEFVETLSPVEQVLIEPLTSKIRIGSLQYICEWKESENEIPDWPYQATLAQIIGLEHRYDDEVLNYKKLWYTIKEAKSESYFLIEQAAELLQPSGICLEDLEMLMDEVIARAVYEDKENVIW